MPSRPSEYGVVFRRSETIGKDKNGWMRWRLTYRRPSEDVERQVNTRGYLLKEVMALSGGDRVNLIIDGRGSVIDVDLLPGKALPLGRPVN